MDCTTLACLGFALMCAHCFELSRWLYDRLQLHRLIGYLSVYLTVLAGLSVGASVAGFVRVGGFCTLRTCAAVALLGAAAFWLQRRIVLPSGAPTQSTAAAQAVVQTPLAVWLAIGILEEVVFRGALPNALIACGAADLAGVASVGLFALSHYVFGWREVFAKGALGACCLFATYLCGGLWGAVVIHGAFNGAIWLEARACIRRASWAHG